MIEGKYWLLAVACFLVSSIMLYRTITYLNSGIYTLTFRGSRQNEYIYKNKTPIAYWFHVIVDLVVSVIMLYVSFWFIDWMPSFKELHEMIGSII